MNTPALTWQMRRIGKSWWHTVAAGKEGGWLDAAATAIRRPMKNARPANAAAHWLAALRHRTA
jgi:hypothetical protein